ncbi:MAG: winged helix-turn-helix domain-containing protein [Nitrososphaerales archaeon]|jgi:predicted transcriptional regulator
MKPALTAQAAQAMRPANDTALGWGNRGALDIINLIVLACGDGTMITHIMYKCNLNSKQTQSYVSYLLQYGLLVKKKPEGSNKFTYQATDRAGKYLEVYSELSQMFKLPKEARALA